LRCGFQNKVCASKSPTFFSRKPLPASGGINKTKKMTLTKIFKTINFLFVFIITLGQTNHKKTIFGQANFRSLMKMKKKYLSILFFMTILQINAQNTDSVQYQWTKSNFGFDIHMIGGYSVFRSDLKDYFRGCFTFGGGLGLYYWRFNTYFRLYGGRGRTKSSFDYKSLNWPDNQRIYSTFPEISFGFAVLDKKIKITPNYGLCWPSIQKNNKDSINQPEIRFDITQIYGLDFRWNCFSFEDFNSRNYRNSFNLYYLFFRVGYMSPFPNRQSNERFNRNNSWLVNFGYGFKMETRKRVK
jgi:hypothetical protein